MLAIVFLNNNVTTNMINGVNTVDFTFATAEGKNTISKDLPKGRTDLISVFQYAYQQPDATISAKSVSNTKEFTLIQTEPIALERVHVQRLQTHAQLRNNRWKYQTFYSLNTSPSDLVMDATYKTPNINNNNNNINTNNSNNNNNTNKHHNNNIENKSAFIKCNNNKKEEKEEKKSIPNSAEMRLESMKNTQQIHVETKPMTMMMKRSNIRDSGNGSNAPNTLNMGDKQLTSDMHTANAVDGQKMLERKTVPNYYRTEDQENAFRRIEDVHNYAKLNRYGNSNESSDGSMRDYDDEEDDDDDEEVDEVDDDDGDDADEREVEERVHATTQQRVKQMKINESAVTNHDAPQFVHKIQKVSKNFSTTSKSTDSNSMSVNDDTDAIVDIETVVGENEQQLMQSPPAHHARRPMNAFLIFCKRHRAIVKDRYKSLENRAITKILGDWWASLDGDEKDCFTKLAQQNKDAFFSAHPNFKWYKLPAPPLRTLSTRPSNAERSLEEPEYEAKELKSPNNKAQTGSYFKLADEAQMGELNSLMNVKGKREHLTQCPLQKALGETTHFLSAHMPNVGDSEFTDALNEKCNNKKRRAITENSFSSNSSEDDVLPRKTSRSCKGKIYQELVSSGQIAPITKKTKTPTTKSSCTMQFSNEFNDTSESHLPITLESSEALNAAASYFRANSATKRTFSESDVSHNHLDHHHDQFGEQFGHFDLEDKIKKLPALSLDAYLQRKRNTKKKKKFTTRKRNSNSVSLPITEPRPIVHMTPPKEMIRNQCPAAVGSQKRKARKESITRRDISAIENEVASLIPMSSNFGANNGCYYFNEMSTITPSPMNPTTSSLPTSSAAKCTEMDSTLKNDENANDSSRAYSNYVDSVTTTSDLFILAEVAAKRTELTN